jgi:hypothetical protein
MITIIITVCYMAGDAEQCVQFYRTAPVTLEECREHERAIEIAVVSDLIRQGFPLPLQSVEATCQA